VSTISAPLRITDLPKWVKEHRKVPDREWKHKDVRTKANCAGLPCRCRARLLRRMNDMLHEHRMQPILQGATGGTFNVFERIAMKTLLASLLTVVAAVWGWDVLTTTFPASAHPLWITRQEALYLSGLLSIALMSLSDAVGDPPDLVGSPSGRHGSGLPHAQVGRHPGHLLCRDALADRVVG
jgi:hypothetical protein